MLESVSTHSIEKQQQLQRAASVQDVLITLDATLEKGSSVCLVLGLRVVFLIYNLQASGQNPSCLKLETHQKQ